VTIALDLAVEEVIGPEVTSHEVRLGIRDDTLASLFVIGGVVRTADTNALIVNASVTLQEAARTVMTDPLGRYRFAGLAAGSYTLHTSAAGFRAKDTPVQVPGTATGAYNLVLEPA
jgi:hypothetical protein